MQFRTRGQVSSLLVSIAGASFIGACGGENVSPIHEVDQSGPVGDGEGDGGGDTGTGEANEPVPQWPDLEATAEQEVSHSIIVVGETFDGEMKRYVGVGALGTGDQDENQPPIFDLYNGAVLKNVILGAPAADGVHCSGSCVLRNVWWEDVGEDAATFRGISDDDVLLIEGGGARLADDKVFQNNGRGTFYIKDFFVQDFGKVYRSCGNCDVQVSRKVVIENLTAVTWDSSSAIVGVNENYGDTAEFLGINRIFDAFDTPICQRYEGNNMSLSPQKTGQGPDNEYCLYDSSTVSVYE